MKTLRVFLFLLIPLLVAQSYSSFAQQLGVITTLAGSTTGFADGTGAAAQFNSANGQITQDAGNLYIADYANHCIRKVVIATGVVTTLAGSTTSGFADGTGAAAQFFFPTGIVADGAGNLYVGDQSNHRIRKIVIASGVVTTLAGSGTFGTADGTGAAAQFQGPTGLAVDGAGNLYVADFQGNSRIRKIVIATGVVTTLAGGTPGSADGTGAAAQFFAPSGIVADGIGNLYVADRGNHRIRKIVIATGVVTTFAGSTSGFNNNLGAGAKFSSPQSLTIDGAGNLYVADQGNHLIRKIRIAGAKVTTLAGSSGGNFDGTGALSQLAIPSGITTDGAGNYYISTDGRVRTMTLVAATTGIATFSGTTFTEAPANDGTITTTRTVTLSGSNDQWSQINFESGIHFGATGVPVGLVCAITRISPTVAQIAFTGSAAAHANANDATATLSFQSAALASDNQSATTGIDFPTMLTIDFNDPPSATYAGTTFAEAGANDGTITVTRDVTLTGDTWLPAGLFTGGGTHYTATGVPSGLAIAINRISATVARISFTGTAAAHQNANDATVTLSFTNAALTGNNAAAVTGLNPASLTLDFNDNPSAAYTGTIFTEAAANNGTITVTRDVTLTGDTWVPAGAFTNGTHYTALVPAGLALSINRISATVARISFTGAATAHQNVHDVNVTMNFTNAALTGNNAAAVTGLNPASLPLDFNDNPSAAYTGTTFNEAGANDGTITVTRDVTLTGDTWVPAGAFTGGGTHFTATGVPTGLTLAINRISATVARISFTGTAAAHANANDATVTLNFTNAALTSGVAAAVTNLNPASLTLDFNDPGPSAAYAGTTFPEAGANNGTITATQDITLTSDTWVPAGLFTGGGTHYTATGVPTGLTIAINRISATVARISFTGTAAAHANADDATVTLNFTNAALTSNNAAAVGGLNPASLTLDFADPAPVAPTAFSAATPPAGTVGTAYSYTFVANGSPTPTYTLFSGTLPTGLTLSGAGVLSSTPTAQGTFGPFVVRATNGGGNFNTANISITINPAVVPPPPPTPPVLTAPTISGGTFSGSVGLPFGANLNAGGNPAPSVSVSAGALPPGVTLSASGLTGIPGQQGTFTFTLTATNSEGTAKADVTVNVGPAVPLITSVSPQSGTYGSTVTIAGYNLAGANAVSIGGVAVQRFTVEGGSITAIVGAGGTGSASVSTPLGGASGGSFTFEVPEPPVLTSAVLAAIPTGDDNASVFIAGRNIPVYASVGITPIASNGRVLGASIPLQIVETSSTGATVLIPVFARLSGTKLVSVRVADKVVSATFAVVQGAPPLVRELSISSTTASGEAFTTFVQGTGFFRNGFARVFLNDDESLYSNVVSANQVRVHIPAVLNVRNGVVKIRIQNLDGQQTEATVRIAGRNAPLITSITPRWVNGNLQFVVQGLAFSTRPVVILGRRQLSVVSATDTELIVAVPADYPVPSFGTALLLVENPDGQRYGMLIAASQFVPPSNFAAQQKTSDELASSLVSNNAITAKASNGGTLGSLYCSPNPASDLLTLEAPAFRGQARVQIVNARGEVVISGVLSGGERLTIDVHALAPGAYFVRLPGENVNGVARFTVVR